MKRFSVPLISGIAEHQALVTSAEITFVLGSVYTVSNLDSLRLHIDNDIAVSTVKTNIVRSVTNLLGNVTSNLLKVDLVLGGSGLTEQNNLQVKIVRIPLCTKKECFYLPCLIWLQFPWRPWH